MFWCCHSGALPVLRHNTLVQWVPGVLGDLEGVGEDGGGGLGK